jgi:hypothetical protein
VLLLLWLLIAGGIVSLCALCKRGRPKPKVN